MPRNHDIKKVLVIGSGPIVIGQAAEFDYAGTQACRSLKEEGVEVCLVNSNPATIMTDKEIADQVYIEPLTVPVLAVHHYGAEHQKKKAIEEMGELITAISREQDGRATPEQVITELADVQIMMRQLALIYGIDAVAEEIDRKQRRLLRRIDKELKAKKEQ